MKRVSRQHEATYSEVKRLLMELPFYWLNSNLIIESVEFIPSFPAYKVGHTIEIYKKLSDLGNATYIELGITQYKSVNDYTIIPLYSTSPPYLVVGSLWIYKVGNVALYKQSETTECYISGNYIFE